MEAEDVLIERTVAEDSNRTTAQLEYQGPLGDMAPVDNILRMRGVFKLAAAWTDAAALDLLAGHLDLQYFSATYLAGTDRAADFRSFSLLVKGFW